LLLQVKYFKGQFQDPNTFVQLPLQSAVHREIARYQLANSGVRLRRRGRGQHARRRDSD
jgi:hypothetical protein